MRLGGGTRVRPSRRAPAPPPPQRAPPGALLRRPGAAAGTALSDAGAPLRAADVVELLAVAPSQSALLSDFDGTLAEVVDDPAAARARPGVPALLGELAGHLGLVAVVSGRPVSFLDDALGPHAGALARFGLYGLERRLPGAGGGTHASADAERWRPAVDAALAGVGTLPAGARLERKGLSFVLHWREAPDAAGALAAHGRALAARHGLEARPGKMSLELLPPGESDKGSVVRELVAPFAAACFLGDDRGDLAAFAALAELARRGLRIARVAVDSAEAPAELLAGADCIVEGPAGVEALLSALAERLAR